MIYLTLEEVLILHKAQILKFSGTNGVRDIRMLESAIMRPQTTFDGNDLYADVFEKAAALVHSLIKNHPFIDGNKRTGIYSAITFIELNSYTTHFKEGVLVKLGLDIAEGKISIENITKILIKNSKLS